MSPGLKSRGITRVLRANDLRTASTVWLWKNAVLAATLKVCLRAIFSSAVMLLNAANWPSRPDPARDVHWFQRPIVEEKTLTCSSKCSSPHWPLPLHRGCLSQRHCVRCTPCPRWSSMLLRIFPQSRSANGLVRQRSSLRCHLQPWASKSYLGTQCQGPRQSWRELLPKIPSACRTCPPQHLHDGFAEAQPPDTKKPHPPCSKPGFLSTQRCRWRWYPGLYCTSPKSSRAAGLTTLWGCGLTHFRHVLQVKLCAAATKSFDAPPRVRCRTSSRFVGCPKFWCILRRAPAALLDTVPLKDISEAPLPSAASSSFRSASCMEFGSAGAISWSPSSSTMKTERFSIPATASATASPNSRGYAADHPVSLPCTRECSWLSSHLLANFFTRSGCVVISRMLFLR